MSPQNLKLRGEVEELLEKLIITEVSAAVWEAFEKAMASLDPDSQVLLKNYFNETTPEKLSEKTGLPISEVTPWLKHVKQEVQQKIKKAHTVRH